MRILVTGGAGYVGSISTRVLLDAGHDVVVLDTLENGHERAVDPRATFVAGDVGDPAALAEAMPDVEAILHCAGYIDVAESAERPWHYIENNALKPSVMLEEMVRRGIGSIVFSSTAAVYGEPASLPISEGAPTYPINVYGASKLLFERALDGFEDLGIRSVRLRYFNVAGAWPDGSLGEAHVPETHIVPRILGAMQSGERGFEVFGGDYRTSDGTCIRDYIHVIDLAEAHRLALERLAKHEGGGVFNLGSGTGYSNLEVVRTCAEVTGVDVDVTTGPRRAGDPAVLVASTERVERELGWRPDSGLEQMIRDAWRWHESHPEGYGDR
ncbi:MAG: UDP-glucose 4-epimerase GalE [Coriobacteriia bacterium]|nr:UDP-glucose 4-epimerase GalE [Coriobacteriia bacterium]